MICEKSPAKILGDKDQLVAVQSLTKPPSDQLNKVAFDTPQIRCKDLAATCSTCEELGIHRNPGWMGGVNG